MILELDQLVASRGKSFSLAPISMSFEQPEIIGLFGHNGAGKTTLLKALAGLLPIRSGRVRSAGGRRPTFLPDSPYIYRFLTVESVPTVLSAYFDDFDLALGSSIVKDLGLDSSKRVSQLSKGMEEQLNLGMTLARRSSIYLFDEPLAAVDPVTRDRMLDLIRKHKPEDALLIISTHLIAGLESLFDECVVLHEGRILERARASDFSDGRNLEHAIKEAMLRA